MFFQFDDDVTTVDVAEIHAHMLSAGYVTPDEFMKISRGLHISDADVKACDRAAPPFKTQLKVQDAYSVVFLNLNGMKNTERAGRLAVFIKKNLMLVVDIHGRDFTARDSFFEAVRAVPPMNATLPKLLAAFFTRLVEKDSALLEKTAFAINRLEGAVFKDGTDENFNFTLLQIKKKLLILKNHYKRLADIAESLSENENDIMEDSLKPLGSFMERVKRLREDADALQASVNHLQDAHSAFLELKLNRTMKTFTSVTTVFFPLTLIVGWYGMNFSTMPEFDWEYGYLFVILLSCVVVGAVIFLLKKRRGI